MTPGTHADLVARLQAMLDALAIPETEEGLCEAHGEESDLCDACAFDRQKRMRVAADAARDALAALPPPADPSLVARLERAETALEHVRRQAGIWKQEARTQKATVDGVGAIVGLPDYGPIVAAVEALAMGARKCHTCGYTLVRCNDCKDGGAVACCPDCDHREEPRPADPPALVALVREWQAARKPTVLATPGEFLAETFQAAVRRMSAADEALAACRLDVAEAETPAAGKRVQTPNEAEMLRALSDALTGGALGRIREGANSDTGRSDAVAGTNDCPVQRREAGDPDALVGHGWGDGARRGADPGDPLLVSEESGRREAAGDAVTSRGGECPTCGGVWPCAGLREELAEIIRWRFRTADGEIMDGVTMLKAAQEIADAIAPYIEKATGGR